MLKEKDNKEVESLDITDDKDNVVGKRPRSEIELGKFRNVRVVVGFLVNSNGELWIPRRASHKKIFPSCLDMSVGGYVLSGEDYDDAFKRELKEELNIDSNTVRYTKLGKLSPYETHVSSFTTIYIVYANETPMYNRNDFSEGSWMKPEDLIEKIRKGEPAKSDLQPVVEAFLLSPLPKPPSV